MSFFVIYRNDNDGCFTIQSGPHVFLGAAKDARQCSGDIVVSGEYLPIPTEEWLWDWEKELSDCYAKRMMRSAQAGAFKRGRGFTKDHVLVYSPTDPIG